MDPLEHREDLHVVFTIAADDHAGALAAFMEFIQGAPAEYMIDLGIRGAAVVVPLVTGKPVTSDDFFSVN